jgi:hypothetical protein
MPQYMLLLYATEPDAAESERREADMPEWMQLLDSFRDEGLLVNNGRLRWTDSATTLRVREGNTEITDGPFAATKEVLAGFYLLDCRDLDHALQQAARVPLARYGSVEVRPIMA